MMLDKDDKRYGYKEGGPGIEALRKEAPEVVERMGYEEGGSLLADDMAMLQEEQEMPTHTMPDGTVMPGAEHGESEEMESETPMESDSEMEDNYLDFIINEALTPEEEEMLMSKLEQDEELAMVFDKVMELLKNLLVLDLLKDPELESLTAYPQGYLMENLSLLLKLWKKSEPIT